MRIFAAIFLVAVIAQSCYVLILLRRLRYLRHTNGALLLLIRTKLPIPPGEDPAKTKGEKHVMREPVKHYKSLELMDDYFPDETYKMQLKGKAAEAYWSGLLLNSDPIFISLN